VTLETIARVPAGFPVERARGARSAPAPPRTTRNPVDSAPAGETGFVRADGTRDWRSEDLADVTTAEAGDPAWLRLRAAVNTARRDRAE
jgi:hypothetical protein